MIFLGIRTDAPLAEFYLYDDLLEIASTTWQADRQLAHGLLSHLELFLLEAGHTYKTISGLFVYQGPGSFTGLRIGVTVINTIAYSEGIAIVGVEGEGWRDDGVKKLVAGESDEIVVPHYGAEPRITTPKK